MHIDSKDDKRNDLTGRDRLVSNVVFNWVARFVFVIAGFIMPRMISQQLGQELLGIWDFAWSLVSYFFMVEAGIGGAVSRYVSRYQAVGDLDGVNRTVSTGSCILFAAGAVVLGLSIGFCALLPKLFGSRLGGYIHEAQWIVLFCGIGLAFQISFSAFGGVLAGYHRWGLLNLNGSGWYAITVFGMIIALLIGRGLVSLAVINCCRLVLTEITQFVLAHHVCQGLRFNRSLVKWKAIRELYVFGVKSLIPIVSKMLLNHAASILIMAYLGPAALALYARPRSLMLHLDKLVQGMAETLTPTTSSLHGRGNLEEIRELLITAARYSFYISLPIVLVLVFFGGEIIKLWMGPRYANSVIPIVLAVGFLIPISQRSAIRILVGLNAHGRAGLADFIAALCSVGLTYVGLEFFRWGLIGVAVTVVLPMTIINLVYLPLLLRQRVGLSIRQYCVSTTTGPALHVLPFAVCLIVARISFPSKPLVGLAWGGTTGCLILLVLYYRYVLPQRLKIRLVSFVGLKHLLA